MKYYPILLDIEGKDCLVVGAGPVGARKAATLEACGARVTVISQTFSDQFNALKTNSILCRQKEYEPGDLLGMFLVFAATNNAQLNQKIRQDAAQGKILCNVVDALDSSDFILPSIVQRGDLILAVSTSGASPALAKKIRQDLEKQIGPEYETILQVMGNIRKKLLASGHAPDVHKKIFYTLIEAGLLEMIKAEDESKINSVLNDLLGKEYNYQELGLTQK
ncbi:MAG: bifunctional precorrin-2 dehydrogenase/sirohydrochlorin ferrochelatase [Pseudomonadota bacterium]